MFPILLKQRVRYLKQEIEFSIEFSKESQQSQVGAST